MPTATLPPPNVDRSRRAWLRLMSSAGLSLGMSNGLGLLGSPIASAAPAVSSAPGFGRAKSVILVYCNGGQSQIDTWDPKPGAPESVRGEFATIASRVPGIQVTEHLPRLAQLADRYTIIRGVYHQDVDHGSASYLAMTGRYHPKRSSNPPPSPLDEPVIGAVLKKVRPQRAFPYDAVTVNGPGFTVFEPFPGQFGGTLGREFEPLVLGDVTGSAATVPDLAPLDELSIERMSARNSLRLRLDDACRTFEQDRVTLDRNTLYRQAYDLLASPRSREAFNLHQESDQTRDRYGRYRSGQACLLARRLVEAGVPLITVMFNQLNRGQDVDYNDIELYGWDTHNDIFESHKHRLLPRFDLSFSALLEDLDQRGLLETTLVVCMGEFGRAPQVAIESKFKGFSPGRKHWASAYSVVMAGAGVTRGTTFGQTDALGAHVVDGRVYPWDLHATMFHALGVDPASEYFDLLQRPLRVCQGRPIYDLYRG